MDKFVDDKFSTLTKILISLGCIFVCFLIGNILSVTVTMLFNLQLIDVSAWTSDMTKEINILKLSQAITSFFTFIVPPVVIPKILGYETSAFLKLKKSPNVLYYCAALVFMIASIPALNLIIEWNDSFKFPLGIEEIMRSLEDANSHVTQLMLAGTTIPDLLINIVIIALIPAVGEEFLFRGLIQKYCYKAFRNPHLAIFITAFIFSAIHFQFYGFIPRLLLGMFFGYLAYYSGSLFPAIFAHFVNNGMAVIGHFLIGKGLIGEEIETVGSQCADMWYIIIGIVIVFFAGRFLFRKKEAKL
jgi:membrane protease YdiL (CAAX protease family)